MIKFSIVHTLPMTEKAPCSCGCGKLVSASTDYRHCTRKTTPRAKAMCLASQSITATTTKFHPSRQNSLQRKRRRTNPGPLSPLKIQDRDAIHTSGLSVNDVPPLSPNHSETKGIDPLVNPCAEAWTNTSRDRATVEDADSDQESGDEGRMPLSDSEDGDRSSLDSDSSDDGLGIEDTIDDKFEREMGNFGAYLNVPSPL